MIKVFWAEFRRSMNIWFIIGIMGVAFSICFDSWNDLVSGLQNHSGYVHYFFWNSAFGGMCRSYLLPIFATLPFATSFCAERKCKSVAYIASREGRIQYGVVKYIVNFVSGGFVVALGTGLVLVLLSMVFPMASSEISDAQTADIFHDWLAVHRPMGYCLLQICLGFFRGMIWSSIALLVSVYIEDMFVVTVSPYVGSFAFVHFCRLMRIDNNFRLDMILKGRSVIHSSQQTVVIALISVMAIVFIVGVVFVRKMERGLRNGTIHQSRQNI